MFRFSFIYKTLLRNQCRSRVLLNTNTSFVRRLRTSILKSNSLDEQSFTVSYLVNSCGLSSEKAISASKLFKIHNTEKPNAVIDLFTSHGFSKSDITTLVSKYPRFIVADPEKTLKPKIEYFESLGIGGPDLPKLLCITSYTLKCSLKNQIMPLFDLLRRFVQTNDDLVSAWRQSIKLISCRADKVMAPNINHLLSLGVPELHIGKLIMLQPLSLARAVNSFEEVANKIKQMGFDPSSMSYIRAVRSMSTVSKAKWESKKNIVMSFGWTEEEFELAFRKQTSFMLVSEKKMRALMECFVNELHLEPADVASCPNLLMCSLEKRIIPRYSFIIGLKSRGLKLETMSMIWILNMSKNSFEKLFVTPFKEDVPDLIELYHRQTRKDQDLASNSGA